MECIFNQVDPQFETTQGLNCRLSILLCQDGFSFLITHTTTRKILKLTSYRLAYGDVNHDEIGGWPANGKAYFDQLLKVDFIQKVYHRIDFAIASHKSTVAPSEFFRLNDGNDIISASLSVDPDEEIHTEPVFDLGPVVAILIPGYLKEHVQQFFPGSRVWSAPALFVKGVIRNHAQIIARQVFINVYNEYFEVAMIQGSRLLYFNSFTYASPSDVLYYVIFVLEQLGFVPSEENVTLMGDIASDSIICDQLKMYCASVSFAEKVNGVEYGEMLDDARKHNYFTLLNVALCE